VQQFKGVAVDFLSGDAVAQGRRQLADYLIDFLGSSPSPPQRAAEFFDLKIFDRPVGFGNCNRHLGDYTTTDAEWP